MSSTKLLEAASSIAVPLSPFSTRSPLAPFRLGHAFRLGRLFRLGHLSRLFASVTLGPLFAAVTLGSLSTGLVYPPFFHEISMRVFDFGIVHWQSSVLANEHPTNLACHIIVNGRA